MKIGMVILNYNDSSTTISLLERIKEYKNIDLIVVVDNCSTDDSYNMLKIYENKKVIIIQSKKNNGYSAGNNIGCKYLCERNVDLIIISNPDVIFEEKDIENLIKDFRKENIGIISPVIEENNVLNRGWKFQNVYIDALSNINYFGRYFKKKRLYDEKYYEKEKSKVDVVSGCFFIISANILKKINYFDENTFLYYEENILAKKLQKINAETYIDNEVKIIHNHSVSINKTYNKINKFKILFKSQKYYHVYYNNTGIVGRIALNLSYTISITISYIILFLKKILYKNKKI